MSGICDMCGNAPCTCGPGPVRHVVIPVDCFKGLERVAALAVRGHIIGDQCPLCEALEALEAVDQAARDHLGDTTDLSSDYLMDSELPIEQSLRALDQAPPSAPRRGRRVSEEQAECIKSCYLDMLREACGTWGRTESGKSAFTGYDSMCLSAYERALALGVELGWIKPEEVLR